MAGDLNRIGFSLFAFVVMTAFWPGLLSAGTAPRWSLLAVVVPLLARLDRVIFSRRMGALLLGGIGYGLIGLWANGFPLDGDYHAFHFLILVGVVIAAAGMDDIESVMIGATFGISVSALLAVVQMSGWSPVYEFSAPAGLFINRDILAETAAPLFVWALVRKRYWLSVCPAIPLMLCQSRAAILMVGVGLLWAAWRSSKRLIPAVVVIIVLTVGMLSISPDKMTTTVDRLGAWQTTVSGITLFGHGIGSFSIAYPFWQFSHSDVLQAFYELGIGAIPFMVLAGLLVWGRDHLAERAAFIALLTGAAVSWPLHLPATGFVAGLLCGHLARCWSLVRSDEHVGRGSAYQGRVVGLFAAKSA